jgi:hypothetical protein
MSPQLFLPLAFVALLNFTVPAHAYIDPGTGSIFLQLVLSGGAGLWIAVRQFAKHRKPFNRVWRPRSAATEEAKRNLPTDAPKQSELS